MKFLIAMDSFKGSMTSSEAGRAAAEGIKRVFPDAETVIFPIADGGEGTVNALTESMGGTIREITVTGPLGRPVSAEYCIIGNGTTAVIEIASAAGLTLVPENERDPMDTTTYGVGEIISDAIKQGCRSFIIGIGGSATNDCGIGMLQALGYEFIRKNGENAPFGAKGLENIINIKNENELKELKECSFLIACDVTNPLCGENGCSAVFAPQKGASPDDIELMDKWLGNFASLVCSEYPDAAPNYEGAGAAGGLGFAFMSFLGGKLERGIDIVIRESGIEKHILDSDIVITGEGRLDAQTAMGKAPAGIAALAKKHGCKVIAFGGAVSEGAKLINSFGIDAYFPILRDICTPEEAMKKENAEKNLADAVEQVMRILKISDKA